MHAFFTALASAMQVGSFTGGLISKPLAAPAGLKTITLQAVTLRGEPMISWKWRYQTRDEVKHHPPIQSVNRLRSMAGVEMGHFEFSTADGVTTLVFNKRGESVMKTRLVGRARALTPVSIHDRVKLRLLDSHAPWLHAIGVTHRDGTIMASAYDKWRQINKFIETIAALIRESPLPLEPIIADMGCGKGYLTFALYQFLKDAGLHPHITGVEQRPELVRMGNETARAVGFSGLEFVEGSISDCTVPRLDMLIALHACDVATDMALVSGIKAGARIMVLAPCCHQQVRSAMNSPPVLQPLLKHGILMARQADLLTDSLRALIMESRGYRTSVFEFISPEHTAKNIMLTAVFSQRTASQREKAAMEVLTLMGIFGISSHALLDMLAQSE